MAILQGQSMIWMWRFTRIPRFGRRCTSVRRSLQGEGKYDLAIQDCNEALRQYPGFIEAALLRARINSHLGKYAEALKEFNYLVSIHPRSVTLARALSDRAWFSGDLPKPIISQWPTGDQRCQSRLQYHDVEGREHDRYAGRSLCRDRRF